MLNIEKLNEKLHKISLESSKNQTKQKPKKPAVNVHNKDNSRKEDNMRLVQALIHERNKFEDVKPNEIKHAEYCNIAPQFMTNQSRSTRVLRHTIRCGNRFCTTCANVRANALHEKVKTIIKAIILHAQKRKHKVDFIFVTLTLPNAKATPESAKSTVKKFHKSFKRLMKYAHYDGWSKRNHKRGIILGAFSKLEETTNYALKNPLNIHLHALMTVHGSYFKSKHYTSQMQWQKDWGKATKSKTAPIVNIRHTFYRDKRGQKHTLENTKDPKKVDKIIDKIAEEISKYISKPSIAGGQDPKKKQGKKPKNKKKQFNPNDSGGIMTGKSIGNPDPKGKPLHPKDEIFHALYKGFKGMRFTTYLGDWDYYSKLYEKGKLDQLKPKNKTVFTTRESDKWQFKVGKYKISYQSASQADADWGKKHNLIIMTPKMITNKKKRIQTRNTLAKNFTITNPKHPAKKLSECSISAIKEANRIIKKAVKKQKELDQKRNEAKQKAQEKQTKKANNKYKKNLDSKYNSLLKNQSNAPL